MRPARIISAAILTAAAAITLTAAAHSPAHRDTFYHAVAPAAAQARPVVNPFTFYHA